LLGQLFFLVRNSLARMTEADKELESERYFIYLISNPRRERDVKEYLMPLLGYFHVLPSFSFDFSSRSFLSCCFSVVLRFFFAVSATFAFP
jgi:hypothetical protein